MAKLKMPRFGGFLGGIVSLTTGTALVLYDRYLRYRAHQRRVIETEQALIVSGDEWTPQPTDALVSSIQDALQTEDSRRLLAQGLAKPFVRLMDHFDALSSGQKDPWRFVNIYNFKNPSWPGHLFGVTTRAPFRLGSQAPTPFQWLLGTAFMFPGGGGELDGVTHGQIDKRWRENAQLGVIRKDLVAARPRIRSHTIARLLGNPVLGPSPFMLGYNGMVTIVPLPQVSVPNGTLQLAVVMTSGYHVLDGIAIWGVAVRGGVPYWVSLHVGKHNVPGVDALNLPFAGTVFHCAFHRFAALASRWPESRARLEGGAGSPLLQDIVDPPTTPVEGGYTPTDLYDLMFDDRTTGNVDRDFGWLLANRRDVVGTNLSAWTTQDGKPIPERDRSKMTEDEDEPPDWI